MIAGEIKRAKPVTKIAGASSAKLREWLGSELRATEERITIRIEHLERLLLERPVPKPDARYGAALRAALDDIAIAINEQKFLNGEGNHKAEKTHGC